MSGFGSFVPLCTQSSLPICSLLGPANHITPFSIGILPTCYARSVEVGNTIIFQGGTDFAHIVALGMTAVMILHVRSKFTAVGRKEILTFFYIYLGLTTISLVLDAGVIEARPGGVFPYFVAIQNGMASALCTCLLINGFVGFQLYEDGTTLSVWLLRLSSLGMFVISFAVSLLTFKSWAGLSPTNTTGLFVVLYLVNGICILVYLIMQVLLVVNTLQDNWPLFDIVFGVFFLVVGQVVLFVFGEQVCHGINHYLDGVFFATVCNLLAVMMVYKYWDSITKEDLEFSVGTKQNSWEVKDPLLDDHEVRRNSLFDPSGITSARQSYYDLAPARDSIYDLQGGGGGGGRNSMYEPSGMEYSDSQPDVRQPPQQQQQPYQPRHDSRSFSNLQLPAPEKREQRRSNLGRGGGERSGSGRYSDVPLNGGQGNSGRRREYEDVY